MPEIWLQNVKTVKKNPRRSKKLSREVVMDTQNPLHISLGRPALLQSS